MSDLPPVSRYHCCDTLRRNAVDAHPVLNGIDWLEVLDRDAPPGSPRQQTLLVRLLKPAPVFAPDNVQIEGGERVRDLRVVWLAAADAPPVADTTAAERTFFAALAAPDHVLLVRLEAYGDFSPYRLRLQRSPIDSRPPAGFDPQLAEVAFSFKVDCPAEFDCRPVVDCPVPALPAPDIDYLAKDYERFRRLMLDRIAQCAPQWQARTPADTGVTLVELFAYAADQFSYWQDAVATEAYLETARRRTSLRRHALLVDYRIDEGCNARTWVQLELAQGLPSATIDLHGLQFLSRVPDTDRRIPADPTSRAWRSAFAALPTVFEPMHPAGVPMHELDDTPVPAVTVELIGAHHEMVFHTWGDRRCCLPAGATSATLAGHLDRLAVGDVLILEEVLGAHTGLASDADRLHRQAVRLVAVDCVDADDPSLPLVDPLPLPPVPVTAIRWAAEDALRFPLCLSATTDDEHGAQFIDRVSVARGNIVLADHGRTLRAEALPAVPAPTLRLPPLAARCDTRCDAPTVDRAPVRYRPMLEEAPLTHVSTLERPSAAGIPGRRTRLAFDPRAAAARAMPMANLVADAEAPLTLPAIRLTATPPPPAPAGVESWSTRADLLQSAGDEAHFVVEIEHDQSATLRFGDDAHGRRPATGTAFTARYRVGQGTEGNLGADAIAHVVSDDPRLAGVRNPLPAVGGRAPESAAQVRRRAPQAFRRQQRAVTPDDYAEVTMRLPGIQRAAATPRWTGSWHTMFVTVDRLGGAALDAALRAGLDAHVEPLRMAGHEVAFDAPVMVSLEIEIIVCVLPDHFRSDVRAALFDMLGRGVRSDGRRGAFHPDAFSFGQPVYLSPVYAAARAVAGVETLEVTRFRRQGIADAGRALRAGVIRLGRLEIARLDNDRNHPEHGVLRLTLHGGK